MGFFLTQPWWFFGIFAGVGLLGYNICAKLGGGALPPVIFATVMYTAGFLAVIPIFLTYLKGKDFSFFFSLPTIPLIFAALAGVSVILVDTSISVMYGKNAPLGLGMVLVQVVALLLTLLVGILFFQEKHGLINTLGLLMALLSIPMMLYSGK